MTQSLAEHLESAFEAPEDPEARAAFRVDGPDEAGWAARKFMRALDESAAIHRQADEQIRRIEDWRARATAPLARDQRFFEALLLDYHRRLLDRELAPRMRAATGRASATRAARSPAGSRCPPGPAARSGRSKTRPRSWHGRRLSAPSLSA